MDKANELKETADKLHSEGKNLEAIEFYRRAISYNGNDETVWGNLGAVLGLVGQKKEALQAFEKALEINPQYWKVRHNKGILLMSLKKHMEAMKEFRKILDFEPKYVDVLNDFALCLAAEKRLEEALRTFQIVVGIAPVKAVFHCNLGSIYGKLAMLPEAERSYLNALCINPSYGEVYANLAALYLRQGEDKKSKQMLKLALDNPTETAGFHAEIGFLLQESSKPLEAVKHMEIAEKMDSNYPALSGWQYLAYRQLMDWRRIDELKEKIIKEKSEEPFISLILHDDDKKNYQVAREWSDEIESKVKLLNIRMPHDKVQKNIIKIGFISYDFRNHPVGQMSASCFSLFDRKKFHITAFSYSPDDGHENRKMAQEGVDEWVDLSAMGIDSVEMAREIYERNIDILVEMTGYTKGNRFGVMAFRSAPIQVSWLGFPGTTGASYIDYIIADKIVVPKEALKYFSEKPVYLPCYQINNKLVRPSDKNYTRRDFKLPEDSFVFGSFNQIYKIEPQVFRTWMNILKRVPDSVLWMWQQSIDFYANLEREIIANGVEPSRVVLAPDLPKRDHLARLKLADLVLDTYTYGGHTTTTDSLWAGTPVLAIKGNHFASRVSASILNHVGLPELVTTNLKDYENMAVKLAHDKVLLYKMSNKLTQDKLEQNLFNTEEYVLNLEKAFIKMYQDYLTN